MSDTPKTVQIICEKSLDIPQRRSVAVRRDDGTWICAACGQRVKVTW